MLHKLYFGQAKVILCFNFPMEFCFAYSGKTEKYIISHKVCMQYYDHIQSMQYCDHILKHVIM